MKVLITGGKGFLAQKLRPAFLQNGWEVASTSRTPFTKNYIAQYKDEQFFVADQDQESLLTAFSSFKPDWVIHAAAAARVDWCEQNPKEAYEANVAFTENVAHACKETNANLAYVSTDYVFDGKKKTPYKENDACNPINVYGKTKYQGEKAVASIPNHLILRIASPYGFNSTQDSSFLLKVLQSLSRGEPVDVADDSITTPTFLDDASNAFEKLLSSNSTGIYHVAGKECISRFQFVKLAAEIFGFDQRLVKPTKMALFSKVPRPSHSCLSIGKLQKKGISMRSMKTALTMLRKQAIL